MGLYHAHRGELDPAALVALEHQRFYVPVLRGKALRFAPLGHARGGRNRFGIAEPLATRSLRPAALDLVITPLVGFDEYGTRLGAGGGFYDRSFALRNRGRNRPLSVGLAFACQQVEALSCQPWDVPLDCIVTERGVIRPLQSPRREAATQE
ncbi:MAG: 5-formyltetrahydrofolate cyclo-ligase [Salinisphaera sp.]|nr:5-formyltetrahydrofolate cyclo-ligase [Salinisphaera sp.]